MFRTLAVGCGLICLIGLMAGCGKKDLQSKMEGKWYWVEKKAEILIEEGKIFSVVSGLPIGECNLIGTSDIQIKINDGPRIIEREVVVTFTENEDEMIWYVPPAVRFASFRRPD